MATVYLAEDLKHGRRVAIKVLHPELAAVIGAERFLAEIKATANLQHPHILGLIDSGEADGLLLLRHALRRRRIAAGPPRPREAAPGRGRGPPRPRGRLRARLRPSRRAWSTATSSRRTSSCRTGRALVADFGIALAVQHASGSRMTQTGMSLGTPAYMSPEQAMGERVIGPRSDVYALGAMTYEMLVGDPPFTGSTVQAIVAKVMTEKPMPPSRIRDTIPPNVEHAVLTALQKLPADRFSTAKDFADALAETSRSGNYAATVVTRATGLPACPPRAPSRPARRRRAAHSPPRASPAGPFAAARARPKARSSASSSAFPRTSGSRRRSPTRIAISPDGDVVAFSGRGGSGPLQIFVRRMDELGVQALPGTEGGEQPFFSPDGKWIAFFANHQMRKVAVTGGPSTVLAELPGGLAYGGAWVPDGRIVVSRGNSLAIIPAGGGAVSSPLRDRHRDRSPADESQGPADGKTVIVTRWRGSTVSAGLWVATIGEGKATDLRPPRLLCAGHDRRAPRLRHSGRGVDGGALRHRQAEGHWPARISPGRHCGRCQRRGAGGDFPERDTGLPDRRTASACRDHRPPWGERFAAARAGQVFHAALFSRRKPHRHRAAEPGHRGHMDVRSPLPDARPHHTEGDVNDRAEWSPDGRRIIFRSNRGGPLALWSQPADGTGKAELVLRDPAAEIWEGVPTADGRSMIYRTGTIGTADIWVRQLTG